ncbi:MAG TPA: hypothetical protein VJB70_04745 [Candidatus Paceibacterota bacterium]
MRTVLFVGVALVVGFFAGYFTKENDVSRFEIDASYTRAGYGYETLAQYVDAKGVLYALLVLNVQNEKIYTKPFWMELMPGVLHDRQGHLLQFLPTKFTADTVFWKGGDYEKGNPFRIDISS